ncbi:2-N-acetylglucosaminyltransferase [Striga asiatica]|uniref:2-N-acetylglucosaminyltransferase n=1 Tax=Striga asiatica TaxID=4170 RepID=A0A5A7Q7U2_STRAF|nr:2-N-acetylglucosaminyltransferase [Striga asiatica]
MVGGTSSGIQPQAQQAPQGPQAPLPAAVGIHLTRALNALEGERELLLEKQTKLMGKYQEFVAFFVQCSTICVLMMAGGLFIGYYLHYKGSDDIAMNLAVEIVAYEKPTRHHQNANGAALYEKREKLLVIAHQLGLLLQ